MARLSTKARKLEAAAKAIQRARKTIRTSRRSNTQSMPFRSRGGSRRTAGILGIEKKFLDTSYTGALVAPTDAAGAEADPGTVLCLNAVAQGDGESNRDGKNYVIRSLFMNGYVWSDAQINQTAADANLPIFVAVVLDMQTNAAQLNSEDVFKNQGAAAQLASSPFRNLQYSNRFKVLWSKRFTLPSPPITYDGTNVEQGSVNKKFKVSLPNLEIRVETKGTSANVTDIINNSLHVIGYCGSTAMAPQLAYNARIRFVG